MITVTEKVTTMNCNDCPNQTDSKCCHQSIKPSASFDDRANDEADRHAQMMQDQRSKQGAGK